MNLLSRISFASLVRLTALAAAGALLSGCALQPRTPEQAVSQRVAAYWQARASQDFNKAYQFNTPAYRKLYTADQFRSQFGAGGAIRKGEAVKVDCVVEKCNVRVQITSTPMIPGLNMDTITSYLDEIWLLEDGQWWRYQDL